jgi:hypothetical protein
MADLKRCVQDLEQKTRQLDEMRALKKENADLKSKLQKYVDMEKQITEMLAESEQRFNGWIKELESMIGKSAAASSSSALSSFPNVSKQQMKLYESYERRFASTLDD